MSPLIRVVEPPCVLPLHAAVMCLDCEALYTITRDDDRRPRLCPICSSGTHVALVTWLNRR